MSKQGKKIDAMIRGIAQRTTNFRDAVQGCAVAIVEHAKDTNDCSRALALVAAVGMASDRVKLIQWFGIVSPINVTFTSDVAKRRVSLRKLDAKGYMPFDVARAKELRYHTVGKTDDDITEELTSGEANTLILKLVKKLQGRLDKGEVAANDKEAVEAKIVALKAAAVAVAA